MGNIIPVSYEDKFCYNIYIEKNWEYLLENYIKIKHDTSHKICIVCDSNTSKLFLKEVYQIFKEKYNDVITFELPAGESQKTLENITRLYDVLIKKNFHRNDILVALGGGVIGDMTGFAAATFLRGIDFIQIPTTLLSQVDSSIGGKTGVDYLTYKNMVGAFHMPRMVYINISVLQSLDDEQFTSGMGEVIKHGCIQNASYYAWLQEHKEQIMAKDSDVLTEMIYESCLVKRNVVQVDPKELGIRAILNYGHTIGHAIETCMEYCLFHGQCVGLGMLAAMQISLQRGQISKDQFQEFQSLLTYFHFPSSMEGITKEEIMHAMLSDKKMTSSHLKFILLNKIGEAYIDTEVTKDEIASAIESLYA